MGSSMSTSTSNNNSNQLELIKKNADEVNKYQNDIQQLSLGIQQLSTQLVKVSSGLEKTLVQQRTDSIELYQDTEEKLKLYKAENDRLSTERTSLLKLLQLNFQLRILSVSSQFDHSSLN